MKADHCIYNGSKPFRLETDCSKAWSVHMAKKITILYSTPLFRDTAWARVFSFSDFGKFLFFCCVLEKLKQNYS